VVDGGYAFPLSAVLLAVDLHVMPVIVAHN